MEKRKGILIDGFEFEIEGKVIGLIWEDKNNYVFSLKKNFVIKNGEGE